MGFLEMNTLTDYSFENSEIVKLLYFKEIKEQISVVLLQKNGSYLIDRIFFGTIKYKNRIESLEKNGERILKMLNQLLVGDESVIPTLKSLLNYSKLTDFEKYVLLNMEIKRGSLLSYKELSIKLFGTDKSRAVGNVMARNRFPIIFPCHRVIRNNGHIGGFSGGIELKRKLLMAEGIVFHDFDRVSIK
jgi:methylated-DNA-[protein]-cysteine S-methyltransferase